MDDSLRQRDGLPRHGHACLGKPKDRKRGHFGLPRRGYCSPRLRLGEGRLRLGEPAIV